MWVAPQSDKSVVLLVTGTLDDVEVLHRMIPSKELFCENRPNSFPEYLGIMHLDRM